MIEFFRELAERRIDETSKSAERENKKEAGTSGNAKNINVDVTFQQNLSPVFEILPEIEKIEVAEFSKKTKRRIFEVETMMENLFQYVITYPTINIQFDTHIMDLARTYFDLGCIYTLISNYLCTAVKHFERVIELIKGKEMHCKAILIAIRVRIKLSEIFANLQQPKKHYQMLEQAMELYIKYTNEKDEYPDPIYLTVAVDHPEEQKKDPKDMLLDFHIKTLEGLENLYNSQCTDMHKFVKHVHNLLNKELIKVISTRNKPSLYWAQTSVSLSKYFLHHKRFMEAEIHLAAADYVRRAYKLKFKNQIYSKKEYHTYNKLHASINIFWGVYGNNLLSLSKERLINGKSCEAINMKSESFAKSEEELPLIFFDLEKELEDEFEFQEKELENSNTYVLSPNDAKVVFKNTLKCFNTALTIFDPKNAPWYHVGIILRISQTYKNYAYFVGNRDEKINLIQQQIKYLKTAIGPLALKVNTCDEYIKHYKKFYVELAITYSTLLDMTYEKFNEIKDVTDEMKIELKQLIKSIIDSYNLSMYE